MDGAASFDDAHLPLGLPDMLPLDPADLGALVRALTHKVEDMQGVVDFWAKFAGERTAQIRALEERLRQLEGCCGPVAPCGPRLDRIEEQLRRAWALLGEGFE